MASFNLTAIVIFTVAFLLLDKTSAAKVKKISEEDVIVEAGVLGKIQGVETVTSSLRPYFAFAGMRYAKPPTGDARFLPSVPFNEKLNATGDIFYATDTGPVCPQPQPFFPTNEDCLFLHVMSPKLYKGNDDELLPVIFFIHGGAFTSGQGSLYNGNRFLDRDVVLVSINYRLGVLGFFSLNTENVPGNAALYDIINALKWTNKYIKYFGGDPNKITIAGQSAGSVAVTHLLASPAARGLFHGAIASSGSALATWGTTTDSFQESLRIANLSNCYDYDSGEPDAAMITSIAECMRKAPESVLINALFTFQVEERKEGRLGFAVVSPTLQLFDTSPGFEKILPEEPRKVFESKSQADVPLMMGTTRHDGSYVLGVYYLRFLEANNYVNETDSDREYMVKEAVPMILQALGIPNEYGVYDSIAKIYLGDSRKSGNFWEMYPGLIDLFSVFFFKASSYQNALYHSALNSNTFWYSFDYQGTASLFDLLFNFQPPPIKGGITHSDDLLYLFEFSVFNDEESAVSNRMLDYWTNFATFGNPTPGQSAGQTWPPLSADTANFLSIGKDSVALQYYDDTWSDIGWELIATSPPPITTTPFPTSDSTEPITTTTDFPTSSDDPGSGSTGSTHTTTSSTPSSDSSDSGSNVVSTSGKYLGVFFLSVHLSVFTVGYLI